MQKRILTVIVIGVVMGGLLFPSLHVAADAIPTQSITLSPATTQLSIDPGASLTKSFDVINDGSQPFDVTLSVDPYYVTGPNYDPHFTQLPGTVDASHWVTLRQTEATLEAGKTFTDSYNLQVPANTAPGGYYVVIFAESSQDQASASGIVAHNRVGNIIYISVNGQVKQAGTLAEIKTGLFQLAPTVKTGVTVANTGGVHFETNATITITSLFGKRELTQTYDRIILPQTARALTTTWTPQAPLGIYKIHREATVTGALKTLPDTWFIVINPWFVSGVLLMLIVLIAFAFNLRTKGKKRKNHKKESAK